MPDNIRKSRVGFETDVTRFAGGCPASQAT